MLFGSFFALNLFGCVWTPCPFQVRYRTPTGLLARRPTPLWSRTLMPAPLLYPAGPYHTPGRLKSVYLCTLRSSAIRQDCAHFMELATPVI